MGEVLTVLASCVALVLAVVNVRSLVRMTRETEQWEAECRAMADEAERLYRRRWPEHSREVSD